MIYTQLYGFKSLFLFNDNNDNNTSAKTDVKKSPGVNNNNNDMDNIKMFAKNEKELETLIHAVRKYSHDIGMEFDIKNEKVMKNSKWRIADEMELPNQDKIWTPRE